MLIFWERRLVVLSQQKTGTSALIHALASRADMFIKQPSALRHMKHAEFCNFICPMFQKKVGAGREAFQVVSVMREPIDWIGSWYRFRARDELADTAHPQHNEYTGAMSFDQFVRDVCARNVKPIPRHAAISTPLGVATSPDGLLAVDRLFPYEDLSGFHALIEEVTGEPVKTIPVNVSPTIELKLSEEPRLALQNLLRNEIELHAALKANGEIDPHFRTMKFLV